MTDELLESHPKTIRVTQPGQELRQPRTHVRVLDPRRKSLISHIVGPSHDEKGQAFLVGAQAVEVAVGPVTVPRDTFPPEELGNDDISWIAVDQEMLESFSFEQFADPGIVAAMSSKDLSWEATSEPPSHI